MALPSTDDVIASLRELWLTDSDLMFLRELSAESLVRLHGEVRAHNARVSDGQKRVYEVMAKATRFIPNFMLAKMSGSLGPYVLAQVTSHLDAKTAAGLAKSFDAQLLGDISLHLDASHAASIATLTELDTLVQITDSLSKKGLHRRLGEISDALDEKMLEKLVQRIRDPERIAAVASHMQALTKLSKVASRMEPKLIEAVVRVLQQNGHSSAALAMKA